MSLKKKEINNEIIDVFTKFLNHHNHRKTPERFSILNEIYSIDGHFDIDSLYEKMNKKITELVEQLFIIQLTFYFNQGLLESTNLEILSLNMKDVTLIINTTIL